MPAQRSARSAARVRGQTGGRAESDRAASISNDLRQFVRIAHAQVETLAGNRMQRLRGVAQQNGACADDGAGELERKRKRTPILAFQKAADARAEPRRQRGEELGSPASPQAICPAPASSSIPARNDRLPAAGGHRPSGVKRSYATPRCGSFLQSFATSATCL